jgi:hypothetical protein
MMEGSGYVQIMMDLDPGGPKTYGSSRSGSPTLMVDTSHLLQNLFLTSVAVHLVYFPVYAWQCLIRRTNERKHVMRSGNYYGHIQ